MHDTPPVTRVNTCRPVRQMGGPREYVECITVAMH